MEEVRLEALIYMEPDPPTVLIVEDHTATRRFLADNLAADGYEPVEAGTAAEGLRLIAAGPPAVAVIDLGLPDRDGLELLSEVRSSAARGGGLDSQLPVLILSGRGSELDRVRGFERGTDDYLVKPFSYTELRGRLDALLRRARVRPRLGRLRVGALELDPMSRDAWVDGERGPPHQQGVRPGAAPGHRTNPCLHARGAAVRSLGLSVDGGDAHA